MAIDITFQFATSDDGSAWSAWKTEANFAELADSRYIKVKATLSGNVGGIPSLEDMTVGYFKKSDILAKWVYFNYSQRNTKTWTTKADFLDGILSNTEVPNGELRLVYPHTSGYAEYILNVGDS